MINVQDNRTALDLIQLLVDCGFRTLYSTKWDMGTDISRQDIDHVTNFIRDCGYSFVLTKGDRIKLK